MEYRAATWRTRRLAAEPCPLWSIGPFAINVLPLKAQVKDRVTRSPTPHHPLKFEITFCVRGVASPLIANVYLHYGAPGQNLVLLAGEIPAPTRGAAASPGIESWTHEGNDMG
jgi:hypothetical protein